MCRSGRIGGVFACGVVLGGGGCVFVAIDSDGTACGSDGARDEETCRLKATKTRRIHITCT
ncbi:hypothetical protein K458DRAFT_211000 [Lentithecium fluviatile CBS 122367]|uniref:Lipoprotein n=1 Tax=Lentithecium fluviatile CBS 122367 TaxID=1168545 RepID=A0A6G1J7Y2_9PLEO|nr:hypothetical protein K458DRAFT_211000 [Lentithecium fluviatile CBS 122367]